MPLRIARVRAKWSNNASPSPLRIALVSAATSSLKWPSISSTASLLASQMRKMAGDLQHQIMVIGVHDLDIGAELSPELGELLHRGLIGIRRRRQDAPAVDEQLGKAGVGAGEFRAGHRVRGNKMDVLRQ